MSSLDRLRDWVRQKFGTELRCGCVVGDLRGARFSDATTVENRDLHTTHADEYRNCTRHHQEWIVTISCDQCGSEWVERHRAGSKVDYGDPNPDADRKLETTWKGKRVRHEDKPVVTESDA